MEILKNESHFSKFFEIKGFADYLLSDKVKAIVFVWEKGVDYWSIAMGNPTFFSNERIVGKVYVANFINKQTPRMKCIVPYNEILSMKKRINEEEYIKQIESNR